MNILCNGQTYKKIQSGTSPFLGDETWNDRYTHMDLGIEVSLSG